MFQTTNQLLAISPWVVNKPNNEAYGKSPFSLEIGAMIPPTITWICWRGAPKKNIFTIDSPNGGFSVGKIKKITLNKPNNKGEWRILRIATHLFKWCFWGSILRYTHKIRSIPVFPLAHEFEQFIHWFSETNHRFGCFYYGSTNDSVNVFLIKGM